MSVGLNADQQAYLQALKTNNTAEITRLEGQLDADQKAAVTKALQEALRGTSGETRVGDSFQRSTPVVQDNADLSGIANEEQKINDVIQLLESKNWSSWEDVQKDFPNFDKGTCKQVFKSYQQVHERLDNHNSVTKVYTNKAEYEADKKAAKAQGKEALQKFEKENKLLSEKEYNDMKTRSEAARKAVEEAKAEIARLEGDDSRHADAVRQAKQIEIDMNTALAEAVNEDGTINVDAYKKYWRGQAGADLRLNLDERTNKYSKNQAKAAGLDAETDHTWLRRIGVGLGTAALTALSMGLIKGSSTSSATNSQTASASQTNTTSFIEGGSVNTVIDENGIAHVTSTPGTVGSVSATANVAVTATATALARAVAKVPVWGQIVGGLTAGTLAAIAVGPDTGSPDIFKGHNCAEALADPEKNVKGKKNQQIMQEIKDLKNIDDETKVMILKMATAKEAQGKGKANKDELYAALELAKYIDEHPEVLQPEPDPVTDPDPDPVTDPDPDPTPDPVPVTPKHVRGRAVDEGVKQRTGFTEDSAWDINNQVKPAAGQYVSANEEGEADYTGDYQKPETITFRDNTNDNNVNKYVYRLVTDAEVEAGVLDDGTKIETGGRPGPFYVLVQADKENGTASGTDIKATHTELYELTVQTDGEGEDMTVNYDLRQYEGMSGYNKSSIVYADRGNEGKGGVDFKFGNWTKQTPARQAILKNSGCTTADELINKMVPKPDLPDLINANPSVFDKDGNIKPDAKWDRLDLPKGTKLVSSEGSLVRDDGPEEELTPVNPETPQLRTGPGDKPPIGETGPGDKPPIGETGPGDRPPVTLPPPFAPDIPGIQFPRPIGPFKPIDTPITGRGPADQPRVDIWVNMQPGPGNQKTVDDIKQAVIKDCNSKGRPLTNSEQTRINNCKDTAELREYLESIGVNLQFAY